MQKVYSSEDEALSEDIDDSHLAKDQKKTIVEKIAVEQDEDDIDEDFVFSYVFLCLAYLFSVDVIVY